MKEANTNNHPMELSDLDLEHVQGGKLAGVAAVETLLWPLPQLARARTGARGPFG